MRRLAVRKPETTWMHLTITMPADVFDELRNRAEETDRNLSNMITVLLRRAFESAED
jgi:hypothetical protein